MNENKPDWHYYIGKGHYIGTVNNVTFKVGYNEDGEMVQGPQKSKLVKYCYTCNELLDEEK